MPSQIDQAFQFQQTALQLREARQGLIASNIANADTPNYQARDIDFASALQGALGNPSGSLQLAVSAPQHLDGNSGESVLGAPVLYRTVLQPSADGNTVNMDAERAQFAENTVRYEASLKFIGQQIKDVLATLQGF
jgi:flagellar basal-body rod protein FlgB